MSSFLRYRHRYRIVCRMAFDFGNPTSRRNTNSKMNCANLIISI